MKREIKFRAWVPNENCMIQHREVVERAHLQFNDNFNHSDIVMQYTGLHDKNGKEIYEGDVVKWDDRSGGKYWRIAEVKFNPDIQFITKNYTFRFGSFIYTDTHNYLEVIGNIYENPELL